ncbi:hypothetical protein GCM10010211_69780 [Streptomyces albospinus]|uniref:Uncharacterized protein n=1 Tax=Streptomyces albospinus TaxID=285515 RepID=A0ABQ2VLW3_9ACTN|nr:hypothetical protein GCM10010211_69780 [Streptomyces albospinus]
MPGKLQRRGERGPDAACADDSDGEPGGPVLGLDGWVCIHAAMAFRSSPRGVPDDSSPCYASVSDSPESRTEGETEVSEQNRRPARRS